MLMSRRGLLGSAAAARALCAKPFAKTLGLSAFTVRGPLASQPAETYKRLAAIGIRELEIRPDQLRAHGAMIADAGMKPVHMFVDAPIVTGAWEEWREFTGRIAARMKMKAPPADAPRPALGEIIELAKRGGVKRLGVSMLLEKEREGAIEKLNRAGEECAKAGLEFYYHNHAYEFRGTPGTRYIDLLEKQLDRKVRLEMDVFWVTVGGEDPVGMLAKWNGRVCSLHLKDAAADAPRGISELEMPPGAFREVGAGSVNWKQLLRAAEKAGVEHYLIEQDATPGDPLDSIAKSYKYLRGLEL
jgi:sugar phosphate isomerase/epimerase